MRFFTNKAAKLLQDGTLDLTSDTVKVILINGQMAASTHTNTTLDGISSLTWMDQTASTPYYVTGTGITAGTSAQYATASSVTLSQAATGTASITATFHFHEDLDFLGQITGLETSGTGYTAGFGNSGRKTLASKTFTESDTNNRSQFDAADVSWTGLNAGIVTGYLLAKEITNDPASPVILYSSDGGFPITTNGGQFDIVWDATGIAYFSVTVS